MSEDPNVLLRKILDQFVTKADAINIALVELRSAINNMVTSQNAIADKLEKIHLELRELSTRIEMALRK